MQNKNHWYRNFRFKLFAVLCAIMLLGQGLFVRPAFATNGNYPLDRNYTFSVISRGVNKLDLFVVRRSGEIWMRSFNNGWSNWSNLGKAPTGEAFDTVTAVAAGNNRWDIFATPVAGAANNLVWHLGFDGTFLWTWESLGSIGNATPYGVQAVSTGNSRIDLFTRDTSTSAGTSPIFWKVWTASSGWSPNWGVLDNTGTAMTFSALAHSGNRIDIFRRLDSNPIGRKIYNGTQWTPVNPITHQPLNQWQAMNGDALYTPYAVSWGTNRIDLFVRGTDNNIWINNTDNAGTNWYGWSSLGRGTSTTVDTTAASAVAWGPNRLDIFMREGSTLWYKTWTGSSWVPSPTTWQDLGQIPVPQYGSFQEFPPLPVSWGSSRIDLFVYDFGPEELFHKWTSGSGWSGGWENLGPN